MDEPTQHKDRPGPLINPTLCNGCGLCVLVCPTRALEMQDDTAFVPRPDACNYTGYCELICPVGAITLLFQITDGSEEDNDAGD